MSEPERVFLGWDMPFLPAAAAWLEGTFGSASALDLSGLIVVTPGSRAGRRLLDLVAARRPAFAPPRMLTAGALPDALVDGDQPAASDLQSLLAWHRALRSMPREKIRGVVPHPPEANETSAWIDLARDVARVHEKLAADGVRWRDVSPRLAALPDFTDESRWRALVGIHAAYRDALARSGVADRHELRLEALAENRCRCDRRIVLVGANDLHRLARHMLTQAASHGEVTALVNAPESEADSFDALGCIEVERWEDRRIDFGACRVRFVDRPGDQAAAVLEELARGTTLLPDAMTVGLGDESFASECARVLERAGLPARHPAGTPLGMTRPALLLRGLARYASTRAGADLSALARHPDIEAFVDGELKRAEILGRDLWLAALDESMASAAAGGSERETAAAVRRAIDALLPAQRRRKLAAWTEPIRSALERVYGSMNLRPTVEEEARLAEALLTIATVLDEQAALVESGELMPIASFSEALDFTISRLADRAIAPQGGDAAVELLGWLELALDDAPRLVIAGFNDGNIPGGRCEDAFLPDHACAALGLVDARRRYARDVHLLTAILRSREVALIAARRDADDAPLAPSRLLLACDDDALPGRLLEYYGSDSDEAPYARRFVEPGGRRGFIIPPPDPAKSIRRLGATAFRDYIACPYRFYLAHVLGIREFRDASPELDAMEYGSILHEALRIFGVGPSRHESDPGRIRAALDRALDEALRDFGAKQSPAPAPSHARVSVAPAGLPPSGRSPAAAIQVAFLRERLGAFARIQAELVADGWRIEHVEKMLEAEISVGGATFTIRGKIDRIDRNPEKNLWRIIDYKSADAATMPEKAHRSGPKGAKAWIDLQLPIYLDLAAPLGVPRESELGYILLPADAAKCQFAKADWKAEDLDIARAKRDEVLSDIARGKFWPPADPDALKRADGFSAICMDAYFDRQGVIASSEKRRPR